MRAERTASAHDARTIRTTFSGALKESSGRYCRSLWNALCAQLSKLALTVVAIDNFDCRAKTTKPTFGFPDLVYLKPDGWHYRLSHGRAPLGTPGVNLGDESPFFPGLAATSYFMSINVFTTDVDNDGTFCGHRETQSGQKDLIAPRHRHGDHPAVGQRVEPDKNSVADPSFGYASTLF